MTEMTMTAAAAGAQSPSPLPAAWRAAVARGAIELRVFFRDRSTVGFIVALPAILLVLLATIFGRQRAASGSDVSVGQLYTAGLLAGGIAATSTTPVMASSAARPCLLGARPLTLAPRLAAQRDPPRSV